jgi:hypothetical protein
MPSGFIAPPRAIAVAPDKVDRIAVVDSTPAKPGVAEGGIVWRSNTGGETWEAFPPVPNDSAVASTAITDIAIGPSRIGMMYGRNYSGKLFAGMQANTKVYYTNDPWSASPAWNSASAPPTGTGDVVLSIAPNFATTRTCYAGTRGVKSFFFISTDNGNTFH